MLCPYCMRPGIVVHEISISSYGVLDNGSFEYAVVSDEAKSAEAQLGDIECIECHRNLSYMFTLETMDDGQRILMPLEEAL